MSKESDKASDEADDKDRDEDADRAEDEGSEEAAAKRGSDEAVSEEDAWCAYRLAQLNADDRYADLMGGPPFLFNNKDSRVSWLNFLASEGQDARKKVRQALGNTWLRGPRYQDTINGR